MPQIYGYIRTSRQLQEGVPGMDPASQELQLQRAGVPRDNIYRDVGVSVPPAPCSARAGTGSTAASPAATPLWCPAIGRRWPDTIRSICDLRDRRVKIRSLAEAEAQWTRYL